MILYGSGMGNSNLHSHERIPIVVAGGASGRLKGGRHIMVKDNTPLSNLLGWLPGCSERSHRSSGRQQWLCATVRSIRGGVMRARHLAGCAVAVLLGVSSVAAATADTRLLEAVKNQDSKTAHALLEHAGPHGRERRRCARDDGAALGRALGRSGHGQVPARCGRERQSGESFWRHAPCTRRLRLAMWR